MNSCHGLRQSNQGFELSYGVSVAGLRLTSSVERVLTQLAILFLEHLCSFFSESWFDCSANLNISLQSFEVKVNFESLILEAVHVDDVLGNIEVYFLTLVILNDEEQIES